MIEILSTGASNTVQDRGRFGYLDAGVGRSGAMDAPALEIANHLIGNAADCAGLEISLFPFRLRFLSSRLFAVVGGDCAVTLGGRVLPSWWAAMAREGETLEIAPPRRGAHSYLAFAGGIDVPEVLGSRSTDLKSGWGGFRGRGLQRGDRLSLLPSSARLLDLPSGFGLDPEEMGMAMPANGASILVRVLPSAEYLSFEQGSRESFFESDWLVSEEANRQGYRLCGPELRLTQRFELFSHGLVPGTIQVPPSGQPIIQLAEANTCGGYPKIANVIEADLWRLAQARAGSRLRFVEISRPEAIAIARRQRAAIEEASAYAALARREQVKDGKLRAIAVASIEQGKGR